VKIIALTACELRELIIAGQRRRDVYETSIEHLHPEIYAFARDDFRKSAEVITGAIAALEAAK
jgi:hypothetical protein